MRAPPIQNRRLLLESLETRTLLAADVADPFGLIADLDLTLHAVSGIGDYQASFSTNFGNHQLVLSGTAQSSVTIDLDLLPDFITNIKISSFASVTMLGTDHVDNLILASIGSVSAPNLSVTQGVQATNVAALTLASLGTTPVLNGTDMTLNVRSLDDTTIFSNLHSLTLTSDSKVVQFIALNDTQTLNLTYVPETVGLSGIPRSSVHIVLPSSDDGHTTPTTPPTDNSSGGTTDGGSTPGSDGGTGTTNGGTPDPGPTSDPDPLVIVSLPIDERTRLLLEQLREILRSSQSDTDLRIFDLFNHTNLASSHRASALLADGQGTSPKAGSSSSFSDDPNTTGEGVPLPVDGNGGTTVPWMDNYVALNFGSLAVESAGKALPDNLASHAVVDVDVSWPTALVVPAGEHSNPALQRRSEDPDLPSPTIEESVRTFGSYVVERVTAEFSPGQQSLVLLVDPQPSRNAAGTRKLASERSPLFGGLATSIVEV